MALEAGICRLLRHKGLPDKSGLEDNQEFILGACEMSKWQCQESPGHSVASGEGQRAATSAAAPTEEGPCPARSQLRGAGTASCAVSV